MARDEAVRAVASWWLRDFLDDGRDVHDTFLWEDVPELDEDTYDEVLDDMAAMIVRPAYADYRAAYDLISAEPDPAPAGGDAAPTSRGGHTTDPAGAPTYYGVGGDSGDAAAWGIRPTSEWHDRIAPPTADKPAGATKHEGREVK